jgi:hypothetical protein
MSLMNSTSNCNNEIFIFDIISKINKLKSTIKIYQFEKPNIDQCNYTLSKFMNIFWFNIYFLENIQDKFIHRFWTTY